MAALITKITTDNTFRVSISMVTSEKFIFVPTVRRNLSTCKSKETFCHIFLIYILIFRNCIKISMNLLSNSVSFEQCTRNKKRVL